MKVLLYKFMWRILILFFLPVILVLSLIIIKFNPRRQHVIFIEKQYKLFKQKRREITEVNKMRNVLWFFASVVVYIIDLPVYLVAFLLVLILFFGFHVPATGDTFGKVIYRFFQSLPLRIIAKLVPKLLARDLWE